MPPPTLSDPWLASRQFGIVIDAGSSGSRLQIYSWKDARAARVGASVEALHSLPVVEKGTKNADDWMIKKEPGISTLGPTPEDVGKYLAPLLDHAKDQIPPSLHARTPIFLLATAGMRLLPEDQQTAVLAATCEYMQAHTNFRLDLRGGSGSGAASFNRCGASIRIISGVEEGLFGWIAVNYLMNGFALDHRDHNKPTTYGFLDMGGASTQMAFEPGSAVPDGADGAASRESMKDVRLRLLNGEEINHRVFVTTWLGFGTNQARERYVTQSVAEWDSQHPDRSSEHAKHSNSGIPDPCLPKSLVHHETPHLLDRSPAPSPLALSPRTLVGTGSFSQCLAQTAPLLNKAAHCPHKPCLFNGVHVPPIDFSHQRFIGVSEYWYSSQHIFGLGGAFDFEKYEQAAEEFCGRAWDDILQQHNDASTPVASSHTWGRSVDQSRLGMQCFKAAWIVNVLSEGMGMPKTRKAWKKPAPDLKVEETKAEQLGLDKGELANPLFQSLDSVSGTAVSWTLGKMVLEASKGIPASSPSSPAIVDPIGADPIPDPTITGKSGKILPFIDFDLLEERLPSRLRRESLGFSPFLSMLYLVLIFSCFVAVSRFRHRFRSSFRRWRRSSFKRDRERDSFINEDGMSSSSSNPPDSPPLSPVSPTSSSSLGLLSRFTLALRRMVSGAPSTTRRPANMQQVSSANLPYAYSRLTSRSSQVSASGPPSPGALPVSMLAANGISKFPFDDATLHPPTPPPGTTSFGLSLSRNSSQMNLSVLVPRATSNSRISSGPLTPLPSGYRTPKIMDHDD